MEKTAKFKKWCAERCGHPLGILMGLDAVVELQIENKKLVDCNNEMCDLLETIVNCSAVKTIDLGDGMTVDVEDIKQLLAKARGES